MDSNFITLTIRKGGCYDSDETVAGNQVLNDAEKIAKLLYEYAGSTTTELALQMYFNSKDYIHDKEDLDVCTFIANKIARLQCEYHACRDEKGELKDFRYKASSEPLVVD